MADPLTVVVCKARAAHEAQRRLECALAEALAGEPNLELAVLPHLYDLSPAGPSVQFLQSIGGHMAVLGWLHPRAAFWVLQANGVNGRMGRTSLLPNEEMEPASPAGHDGAQRTIWCLDLDGQDDAGAMLREIERFFLASTGRTISLREKGTAPLEAARRIARIEEPVLPRWYPVIDLQRCTNCLECLNFCLFGVYGLDEAGHVFVEQSDACRNGCPACSRICPSEAILFPEHDDPAIADDPSAPIKEKFDLQRLFAGPDAVRLADAERQQALKESQIPPAKDPLDQFVDELDQADL